MLNFESFANLIETAPLISIDLIIRGNAGYLLGMRNNQPAKGKWFVPGGRIFKNETISHALNRISAREIGVEVNIRDIEFYGVFEHFYDNSFVSSKLSTHYIVLAYSFYLEVDEKLLPLSEHNKYKYFNKKEISSNNDIHRHTKNYFLD